MHSIGVTRVGCTATETISNDAAKLLNGNESLNDGGGY